MREAIAACERISGNDARLDATPTRRGWATTAGGSPTCAAFKARLSRTGSSSTTSRRRCGRSTTPTSSAGAAAALVKLSVVIPAHNEALVIEPTLRGLIDVLEPEIDDFEIVVVDDGSTRTAPRDVVRGGRRPRCAASSTTGPHGFGFAVRRGLDAFEGDAVVLVMADGSDDPRDVVLYYRVLEAGYDCAFGSRFMPGAVVSDYPRLKLIDQPDRQPGHPAALPPRLQRHDERVQGLPARGHRERPAAALAPLQPHRRAAAEGGHARLQLRDRPDLVDQPRGGRVQARAQRDGQPLPVHRALRLPRAAPQPRRLPASRAHVIERPARLAVPEEGGRQRRFRRASAAPVVSPRVSMRAPGAGSGSAVSVVSLAAVLYWMLHQPAPQLPDTAAGFAWLSLSLLMSLVALAAARLPLAPDHGARPRRPSALRRVRR